MLLLASFAMGLASAPRASFAIGLASAPRASFAIGLALAARAVFALEPASLVIKNLTGQVLLLRSMMHTPPAMSGDRNIQTLRSRGITIRPQILGDALHAQGALLTAATNRYVYIMVMGKKQAVSSWKERGKREKSNEMRDPL